MGPGLKFANASLRNKLLAISLLPLWVVLPLLGLILIVWGDSAFDRVLITKIRSDLAVAHGYFERVQAEVGAGTRAAAESHALVSALKSGAVAGEVPRLLASAQRAHGLEFLNLLTPEGRLWASVAGLAAPGGPVQRFADEGNSAAMLAVLSREQMRLISPALAERLGIPIVPTPNAAPTDKAREDRAMVLLARIPVRDEQARLLAYLQGGVLLNRNLAFIDHINEIVYPEGSLPSGSKGTATLFLDDVRISTNVRLFQAEDRAIGTRVSAEVRAAVLGNGATWLARAFVVSDWYVSAYEPLHDRRGERVGMLYVGFLERPFLLAKYFVLAGIAAVFLSVMLAAAWLSLRLARSIFRPVERMTQTMARVESGDTAARVGTLPSQDELGQLAGHLDHLLGVVHEKTEALDQKVAERTRALEAAQTQLLKSEKMAAVGQLTASIAHEVNNPIAVIQGNLDLVRELLGQHVEPVQAELKLIDQQIERMRLIVTQLLQYARPTEYAGYVEAVDCGEALASSLLLLEHQLGRARIAVLKDFRATRRAGINRQELQQVLINLLVNAAQAMPEGGTLSLSTRDWRSEAGQPGVEVEVADTGSGLSDALMAKLFQPFITTKSDGTGLGLWISRSLVERYGGELRAEPAEPGARFLLCLLTEAVAPGA